VPDRIETYPAEPLSFDDVRYAHYLETGAITTADIVAMMASVREHYEAVIREGNPADQEGVQQKING
jgi:hypothetical protein